MHAFVETMPWRAERQLRVRYSDAMSVSRVEFWLHILKLLWNGGAYSKFLGRTFDVLRCGRRVLPSEVRSQMSTRPEILEAIAVSDIRYSIFVRSMSWIWFPHHLPKRSISMLLYQTVRILNRIVFSQFQLW